MLYECLTGVVPFPKPSDAAVLYAHMADAPPLVTDQRPELPPALDAVIARGMAKDPADRQATASAMIADAERAFGRRVRAVITPPGPVEGPEDIGLREDEARVSTQEGRVRPQPAPPTKVAAEPVAAPPAAAPAAQAAAQAAAPADDTVVPEPEPTKVVARERTPAQPPTVVGAERAARPPRRSALVAGALLGVALLAGAGFGAGRAKHSGSGAGTPAPLVGSASNSDVALEIPAVWRRAQRPPAIAGLDLTSAMTLAAGARADAGLVVGRVGRAGAGLLPAALAQAAKPVPGLADPVRTPRLQGYRNLELRVPGYAGVLDVVTTPTSGGTLAFACFAPAADDAVRDTCARVVASARLVGRTALPIGTDGAYARRLSAALARLGAELATRRRALAGAKTRTGQAQTAAALARAYASAATSVQAARPEAAAAGANAALAAALTRTRLAYERMGAAARSGTGPRYRSARGDVTAGEAATRAALAALARVGYAPRGG